MTPYFISVSVFFLSPRTASFKLIGVAADIIDPVTVPLAQTSKSWVPTTFFPDVDYL